MSELKDDHYLKAVTEFGDTRKIVADRDIYSESGMKLVAAGVHINSDLYERLVKHKLLHSLDNVLSVDNMLNSKGILEDVRKLFQSNSELELMLILDKGYLDRQILAFKLPSPLAFKLTVAREKFSGIYKHSLLLMVISDYIAHCDGMNLREHGWVALAALFQNIGLLHIDPKLLDPFHVMSDTERRHLYSHPMTAYMLLCEFPELPKEIADTVLEHHERMDGSGYPRGLHGNKISRYSQILAVAELAAKAFDSNHPKVPWEKLEVMLKLNSKLLGQGLIGHLNILKYIKATDVPTSILDTEHLVTQIKLIAKLFEDFNHHSDFNRHDKIFDHAQGRLAALRLELLDAGFDPRNPGDLIQRFTDDPECRVDYMPLLNESLWKFKALISEISRRWPELIEETNIQPESPERAWLDDMKQSLPSSGVGY